jgi:hypothetical protein
LVLYSEEFEKLRLELLKNLSDIYNRLIDNDKYKIKLHNFILNEKKKPDNNQIISEIKANIEIDENKTEQNKENDNNDNYFIQKTNSIYVNNKNKIPSKRFSIFKIGSSTESPSSSPPTSDFENKVKKKSKFRFFFWK